jgi:hypothetical protein
MQEYALGLGQELVIEGRVRLTILAVLPGEVVLGMTTPEPSDGGCPSTDERGRPGVRLTVTDTITGRSEDADLTPAGHAHEPTRQAAERQLWGRIICP